MTLKIYGNATSRARRVIWCARELGLAFEQIDMDEAARKSPEFLAINPNGKVPAITDDGEPLFESLAINLYLARKYGVVGGLYPSSPQYEAQTIQWTIWSLTELERALTPILDATFNRGSTSTEAVAGGRVAAARALHILESHFNTRNWLVEDHFTVADLNMACVVMATTLCKIDLAFVPRVQGWLGRCLARPAAPAQRQ